MDLENIRIGNEIKEFIYSVKDFLMLKEEHDENNEENNKCGNNEINLYKRQEPSYFMKSKL